MVRAQIKDVGVDGTFYPYGSQDLEFEALVRYGMTPVRALQTATSFGGRESGMGGSGRRD